MIMWIDSLLIICWGDSALEQDGGVDQECISSSSFSALVNGSPTRQFSASRGLRQGDSLSPFLFTIVTEALGALLIKAKEIGFVSGLKREGI